MLAVSINHFEYNSAFGLTNLHFRLKKGEHLAILGESGCGKSTLLHLIYGLLPLDDGAISWDGKKLLGPKHNLVPGESFIKLVAQELNVMPFTPLFPKILPNTSAELTLQKMLNEFKNFLKLLD